MPKFKVQAAGKPVTLAEQAKYLLFKYELLDQGVQNLRSQYAEVFARLEELEADKAKAVDELKRLFYTDSGPPKEVPPGWKSYDWAVGNFFKVQAQYKKKADFYDPAILRELCPDILAQPNVVKEVNFAAVHHFAVNDGRVQHALKVGGWMKPTVVLPRLTKDGKE